MPKEKIQSDEKNISWLIQVWCRSIFQENNLGLWLRKTFKPTSMFCCLIFKNRGIIWAESNFNLCLLSINKQWAGPILGCYILLPRMSSHHSPYINGPLEHLRRIKAQFDGCNGSHWANTWWSDADNVVATIRLFHSGAIQVLIVLFMKWPSSHQWGTVCGVTDHLREIFFFLIKFS